MEEHQVTVDGMTHPLPAPFFVLATQNPYDAAGTAPLPHGQRDRFLVRLALGYPGRADMDEILAGVDPAERARDLQPVVSPAELASLMATVAGVHTSSAARAYVIALVEATRDHPSVSVGASPRAARALQAVARSLAVAHGRGYVTADDVQEAAVPTLAHRLLLGADVTAVGGDPEAVIGEVLRSVPVPPWPSGD
jgi:MoxR-like ATPase